MRDMDPEIAHCEQVDAAAPRKNSQPEFSNQSLQETVDDPSVALALPKNNPVGTLSQDLVPAPPLYPAPLFTPDLYPVIDQRYDTGAEVLPYTPYASADTATQGHWGAYDPAMARAVAMMEHTQQRSYGRPNNVLRPLNTLPKLRKQVLN